MKKVLATIGLGGIVALSSYGQGYVIFSSSTQNISTNNTGSSGATIPGVGATAGRTQGAGDFYYALFWSSTVSTGAALQGNATGTGAYAWNTAGWTFDSDPTAAAASTATTGRFAATSPNSDGSTTVPGVTGGNQYYFCIVGWSANLGTTLAQMEANLGTVQGYLGESAVSGLITTGNGTSVTPGGIMGGLAPTIQAFSLGATTIVPEPGTIALAALGGASLLLLRRKK